MSKRSRSESNSPSAGPEARSRSYSPASSTTSLGRAKIHLLDTVTDISELMHCSLPPHRGTLSFSSYEEYEVHYLQAHVNRCSECGRNFPTDRILNLHIEENHDPLTAEKRERGEKTYGCFIEDCERKCSTPQKRRMHLIDKHMFPKTYNFFIVNDGIDKETSLLRPVNASSRRMPTTPTSPQEGRLKYRKASLSSCSDPAPRPAPARSSGSGLVSDEPGISQLEHSMSALKFVPTSVTTKGKARSNS
ncbi:hypothetical protein EYZ11_006175 [Aspergillus tanneri]|uniref:C2H2-type domain-containing protein n=1 Tax=Aspergillus tanneri TaxID=1220188 RepID=A0A4S3JG39_9EURO|nr:uncharacterized protein ATNIH1004_009851 [Aspergillus tanneri]KAA8643089.1 hypothetical protein ATNIH1004_009851 [Aspergillus tanneri]THC94336.1 hypothetical protein EYZ11_006175 [Aspergillus tanneri]